MTRTEIKPMLIKGLKIRRSSWPDGICLQADKYNTIKWSDGSSWKNDGIISSIEELRNPRPYIKETDWEILTEEGV
jgi:hypothetical protein